jgi:hypothetical protein
MTREWQHGVKMSGVNDITSTMTPKTGVVGKVKKNGDVTTVGFNGNNVEPVSGGRRRTGSPGRSRSRGEVIAAPAG